MSKTKHTYLRHAILIWLHNVFGVAGNFQIKNRLLKRWSDRTSRTFWQHVLHGGSVASFDSTSKCKIFKRAATDWLKFLRGFKKCIGKYHVFLDQSLTDFVSNSNLPLRLKLGVLNYSECPDKSGRFRLHSDNTSKSKNRPFWYNKIFYFGRPINRVRLIANTFKNLLRRTGTELTLVKESSCMKSMYFSSYGFKKNGSKISEHPWKQEKKAHSSTIYIWSFSVASNTLPCFRLSSKTKKMENSESVVCATTKAFHS